MIKIYRKTTTIKAEQFDGSDEMIEKYDIINTQLASTAIGFEGAYFLPTMEGELRVNIGDWIASGVEDENWAIADDVFKKTYAELPVIPKYVADYIDMLKNSTDVVTASIGALEYGWGEIELINWIDENGDTFARAWLDGYQIEED
jgi:hypothetical protein